MDLEKLTLMLFLVLLPTCSGFEALPAADRLWTRYRSRAASSWHHLQAGTRTCLLYLLFLSVRSILYRIFKCRTELWILYGIYIRMNKYWICAQCALGDLHLRLKKMYNLESKFTWLRSGSSISVKKKKMGSGSRGAEFHATASEYTHLNNVFQKLVFFPWEIFQKCEKEHFLSMFHWPFSKTGVQFYARILTDLDPHLTKITVSNYVLWNVWRVLLKDFLLLK
jgi:hypothetical protein